MKFYGIKDKCCKNEANLAQVKDDMFQCQICKRILISE